MLDARSTTVLIAFAAIAGLLSGVPALQASRADLVGQFCSGLGVRQARIVFRHLMLVAQVALALVLVVASGLFVRSVQNFRADFASTSTTWWWWRSTSRRRACTRRDDQGRVRAHARAAARGAANHHRGGAIGFLVGVGGASMVTAVRRSAADRSGCCPSRSR